MHANLTPNKIAKQEGQTSNMRAVKFASPITYKNNWLSLWDEDFEGSATRNCLSSSHRKQSSLASAFELCKQYLYEINYLVCADFQSSNQQCQQQHDLLCQQPARLLCVPLFLLLHQEMVPHLERFCQNFMLREFIKNLLSPQNSFVCLRIKWLLRSFSLTEGTWLFSTKRVKTCGFLSHLVLKPYGITNCYILGSANVSLNVSLTLMSLS